MLNCYMYEEIDDFDLDFNSSIQQLLTTYNTLIYELSKTFDTFKNDEYSILVSLNLRKTVSNYLSINYNVYHLTTPELVFSTIIKEIFNSYEETLRLNPLKTNLLSQKNDLFVEAIKTNEFLFDMYKSNQIEFERINIDIIRVIYTYYSDVKLFGFWFWVFNVQNSSLYNSRGSFNEDHFKMELFRELIIVKIFYNRKYPNIENNNWHDLECPIPEFQVYWDRHYATIKSSIDDVFYKNPTLESSFNNIIFTWEKAIAKNTYFKDYDDRHDKSLIPIASIMNSLKGNSLEEQPVPIQFSNEKESNKLAFINQLMNAYLRVLHDENYGKIN
ncbi:MAG: hypothetical protein ACK4IX_18755, partial [Candidatus Sericytochromatia bacterium]